MNLNERQIKNDNNSKWLVYKLLEALKFSDIVYTPGQFDHVDLEGTSRNQVRYAIEVKNRYVPSTTYHDNRCDSDKLSEIQTKYNGNAILCSIYTDNVIKVGLFKDAVIQEMDNQPRNTYFGGQGQRKTKQAVIISDDRCVFFKFEFNSNGDPNFKLLKRP